ncbi:hypothetical protein BH09PAT3_BH09PAT3_5350 [soil metagenome]
MTEVTSSYIPGVCNINTAETNQRRKAGYVGLGLFVVLLVVMLALPIDTAYRLVLILPAMISAIGFLQARNHFCVGYANAGMQNADEDSTDPLTIALAEAVTKDKKRARQMYLQALIIAIVAGGVTLLIPSFNY